MHCSSQTFLSTEVTGFLPARCGLVSIYDSAMDLANLLAFAQTRPLLLRPFFVEAKEAKTSPPGTYHNYLAAWCPSEGHLQDREAVECIDMADNAACASAATAAAAPELARLPAIYAKSLAIAGIASCVSFHSKVHQLVLLGTNGPRTGWASLKVFLIGAYQERLYYTRDLHVARRQEFVVGEYLCAKQTLY